MHTNYYWHLLLFISASVALYAAEECPLCYDELSSAITFSHELCTGKYHPSCLLRSFSGLNTAIISKEQELYDPIALDSIDDTFDTLFPLDCPFCKANPVATAKNMRDFYEKYSKELEVWDKKTQKENILFLPENGLKKIFKELTDEDIKKIFTKIETVAKNDIDNMSFKNKDDPEAEKSLNEILTKLLTDLKISRMIHFFEKIPQEKWGYVKDLVPEDVRQSVIGPNTSISFVQNDANNRKKEFSKLPFHEQLHILRVFWNTFPEAERYQYVASVFEKKLSEQEPLKFAQSVLVQDLLSKDRTEFENLFALNQAPPKTPFVESKKPGYLYPGHLFLKHVFRYLCITDKLTENDKNFIAQLVKKYKKNFSVAGLEQFYYSWGCQKDEKKNNNHELIMFAQCLHDIAA